MKENFTRVCFAFLFVLLCSCAVDPTRDIVYSEAPSQELLDSYLTLDELVEGYASITYEAGTDVIKVYSDRKWTITSPTSWFTLKTYQGYKYTDINIQQEQNPYNFVRRGELIITVTATDTEPEIVYNIMVKQMGDPDAGDASLSSPYIEFTSSNVDNDIQWETISGANYYRVMVSKDETFADDQIVANHLIESSAEEYYTYDLSDVEYLSTSGYTMVDNRTGETFTANAYVDGETYVRVDAVIYVDMDDDGIEDLYAVSGENYLKRDKLFGGGSGTESDPFLISTPNHFRNIKLITNPSTDYSVYSTANPIVGYFKQTADLDFSEGGFFPVGTCESNSSVISSTQHIFQGVYDAGKTAGFSNGNESERWSVKNVKYDNSDNTNVALFAHLGNAGSVSNIDVENIYLVGKTNVGSIVGYNGGTVEYCRALDGTISSVPAAISGGIVANMYNGTVTGCDNYMTGLSDGATIGGIVAMITLTENVTKVTELPVVYITDCQNHGAFVGGSSMANMGGIVGSSSCTVANAPTLTSNPTGVDDERYINVYRCVNYAYLTTLNAGNKSNIAGIFAKQTNIGAHIYQCGNEGDIYFPELSGAGCGGICGYTSTYITDGFVHQFEECYNTGNVKSLASLAGAAGICCRNEKVHSVFTNCYNQGKIEQCYELANNSTEGSMSFTTLTLE